MKWGTQTKYLAILAVAIAIGVSAFWVESLRLASIRRWVLPLLLWLCVALGGLLIVGYIIWPSAWQLDRDPTALLFPSVVIPTTFATFVIGIVLLASRFQSEAYAVSLKFSVAPFWVKWSLWGCKSTRFAIIATPFEVMFYGAIFYLGFVMPPPGKWILIGLAVTATIGPIVRIFAIRWVLRNGGWNAQLDTLTRATRT